MCVQLDAVTHRRPRDECAKLEISVASRLRRPCPATTRTTATTSTRPCAVRASRRRHATAGDWRRTALASTAPVAHKRLDHKVPRKNRGIVANARLDGASLVALKMDDISIVRLSTHSLTRATGRRPQRRHRFRRTPHDPRSPHLRSPHDDAVSFRVRCTTTRRRRACSLLHANQMTRVLARPLTNRRRSPAMRSFALLFFLRCFGSFLLVLWQPPEGAILRQSCFGTT